MSSLLAYEIGIHHGPVECLKFSAPARRVRYAETSERKKRHLLTTHGEPDSAEDLLDTENLCEDDVLSSADGVPVSVLRIASIVSTGAEEKDSTLRWKAPLESRGD